jgi:hypothetical protein
MSMRPGTITKLGKSTHFAPFGISIATCEAKLSITPSSTTTTGLSITSVGVSSRAAVMQVFMVNVSL